MRLVVALILGMLAAYGTGSILKYISTPHEVQNCFAGRAIFDRPLPESVARDIHDQIVAEIAKRDATARSNSSPSYKAILQVSTWFLDPIALAVTALFTMDILCRTAQDIPFISQTSVDNFHSASKTPIPLPGAGTSARPPDSRSR